MTDLNRVMAFRDVQVAMDFQQMAAEGYLDTEFTMYGTTYYQNGERHYLLSASEEKIIHFIDESTWSDIHPMPLETLTEICHVPLGEKETIAQSVKIHLAQKLSQLYPLAFLEMLEHYAATPASDMAYPLLLSLYKQVKNTFELDSLLIVKRFVQLAYASKSLQKTTCQELLQRLAEEEENLQDDIIAKANFKKSWYTLAYRTQSHDLKLLTNARLPWVYHKKQALESTGYLVSPILEHTYWYDQQSHLEKMKSRHQHYCETVLNEAYFQQLEKIVGYPSVVKAEPFLADLATVQNKYGEKALQAMTKYGRLWHIFV